MQRRCSRARYLIHRVIYAYAYAGGTYATEPGLSQQDDCHVCHPGKYSAPDAMNCLECPRYSNSSSGTPSLSGCNCIFGFMGPPGGPCKQTMDIVELTLSYSTAVAGAENEIQVVFACNELVSEGSTVALSGLMGSPRQTGPLVLLYVRTTLLSSLQVQDVWWDQNTGTLSAVLLQPLKPFEQVTLGFTVRNPLQAQRAPAAFLRISLKTAQLKRQVDPHEHVLLSCAEHYFGEPDCPFFCSRGRVAGKMCLCADSDTERHFGHDCSQTLQAKTTIPDTWVQANSKYEVRMLNSGGAGLIVPPFSLAEIGETTDGPARRRPNRGRNGASIRVEQYDIAVTVSDQQPGPAIKAAGGVAVLLPHGLQFQQEVSLIMSYDKSKVGPGESVFIHYLNQTGNIWQQMQGNKVGDGLIETKTTHFSTFAPMVSAAPAGYKAETKSIPPPAMWLPPETPPPPKFSPLPGTEPNVSRQSVTTLVIIMLMLALVISLFLLLLKTCWRQQRALLNKANALDPETDAVPADVLQSPAVHKKSVVAFNSLQSDFVFSSNTLEVLVILARRKPNSTPPHSHNHSHITCARARGHLR